jgi:hypothetical protein
VRSRVHFHVADESEPGLRGINKTAPYFINNSAATLEEMVDHDIALFRRAEVNFVPGPTAVVTRSRRPTA